MNSNDNKDCGSTTTASEINLDLQRPDRIGMAEAVYCPHKSIEQLSKVIEKIQATKSAMLFTRLDADCFAALNQRYPGVLNYDGVSRTAFLSADLSALNRTEVAVVTGGSSDVPIAREAVRTLAFVGEGAIEINDVGVAGLWRLQQRLDEIKAKPVIICVAGMDAALPTVLAGLVSSVVIAVPSSVGYGVANDGKTALNSLLCSCAPGLVVVNIDNGYGAACAALRYLRQLP